MPDISYIELFEKIEQKGVAVDKPCCCASSYTHFKLLRVQMQGDIQYSEEGVRLEDEEHDRKCRELLELAKRNFYDLVLFPEYCISYNLLEQIVSERNLWPDNGKLWCLPCQGIPKAKFDQFIEELKQNELICLIEDAISDGVIPNPFVNALFYCLPVKKDGKTLLCLAPQLKTYHMGDHDCVCESAGLTTGSRIFKLNDRLITFLCADTLNNDIYWKDLQDNAQTNGMIILHPQMNISPKHKDFRRVRDEMLSHNHQGLCITCNWAAGTRLIDPYALQTKEQDQKKERITLSWSCVYQKYTNLTFKIWQKNTEDARLQSANHDLFAAFMNIQKTEVWFSTSVEQATSIILPNPTNTQYGSTNIRSIKATNRYCWREGCWIPTPYSSTLAERLGAPLAKKKLDELAEWNKYLDSCYHFPLTEPNKYIVDRFFDMTFPRAKETVLTIDEQENLADWALLLEQEDFIAAAEQLERMRVLTQDVLKEIGSIPERLSALKGQHQFIYEVTKDASLCFNISSDTQKMLIILAKNRADANKISTKMQKEIFRSRENCIETHLGVIYLGALDNRYHFLPETNKNITRGEHLIQEGDLTNGGD